MVMRIKEMIIEEKKVLIVKQILLISTIGNVWRIVWRIFKLKAHEKVVVVSELLKGQY